MSDGYEDQVSNGGQQTASLALKGSVQSEDERAELEQLRAARQRRREVSRGARLKAAKKRQEADLVRTAFEVPRDLVSVFRVEAGQLLSKLRRKAS